MSEPTPQVLASRQLLQEVCTLLAPFRDDAVLIGGWVPEIRFPDAFPGHVGSIDVDFAMRASKARHAEVVALLAKHGFRPGAEPYQFLKNMDVDGKSFPVKLDLLTSPQHHAATFADTAQGPFPALGTELAFTDNTVESVGAADVRVASIVPFVIMMAYAMLERTKPKDAYDLNFCLENYPGGIPALAAEFATFTTPCLNGCPGWDRTSARISASMRRGRHFDNDEGRRRTNKHTNALGVTRSHCRLHRASLKVVRICSTNSSAVW
jgi:hypothetical protein